MPIRELPLVTRIAELTGVREWTDLGSGNGDKILTVTAGLNLRGRHSVVIASDATCRRLESAGWSVRREDIRQWVDSLPADFGGDCVSLFDVIEHFEPDDAMAVLDRLERAFRVVILFTPRGFMKQDAESDPELAGDPLMWHRSGFTEADFLSRGYVVWYWPVYHFPPNVRPQGALLAVKSRDAAAAERTHYQRTIVRRYRELLMTTTSLPGFLARSVVWLVGGNKAVRRAMMLKRRIVRIISPGAYSDAPH